MESQAEALNELTTDDLEGKVGDFKKKLLCLFYEFPESCTKYDVTL